MGGTYLFNLNPATQLGDKNYKRNDAKCGPMVSSHSGNTRNSCYECKMVVRLWRHCTRIVLNQAADCGSWTLCIAQIGEVTSVLNSVACRRNSRICAGWNCGDFSVIAPSASAWLHFIQVARIRMEVVAVLFVSPPDTGLHRCVMRVTRFMCMCFYLFIYFSPPSSFA